jgi:hypothetical protein
VQSRVSERNKTFKIADVKGLPHEALDSIDAAVWNNCLRHAENLPEEDFAKEMAQDEIMEPICSQPDGIRFRWFRQ